MLVIPAFREEEAKGPEVQGHPALHGKFKASLGKSSRAQWSSACLGWEKQWAHLQNHNERVRKAENPVTSVTCTGQ